MKHFIRKIISAALAAAVIMVPVGKVHAEGEQDAATENTEKTYEEMLQEAYDVAPDTNSISGWPQGPNVYGRSAVVMDMNSGAVLYGKKINDRHFPASITKLMTALVALENSEPDDKVYFSEDSVSFLEYGDASIGMTPGEILSMNDAMYGMLLASANEVSYAIAESVGKLVGGNYDTFIQMMNDRAAELGCTGSHWVNANGLHDEQHYTTAHDMALIASAVYQFDEFRKVTQTLNYTIGPTNLVNESRTFQQNHKMLWPGNYYYYEYCTGGKTGYTDQAKTTLVTMADNGELQLAAVLLEDIGDVYVDTRAMFDYAFDHFSKVLLSSQQMPDEVDSWENTDAYVVLPEGIDFSALEKKIEITDEKTRKGTVTYYYEGQMLGSADAVLTAEYVEKETGYSAAPRINKDAEDTGASGNAGTEGKTFEELYLKLLLVGVCAVIIILFLIAVLLTKHYEIKRRRQRIAARRQHRRMKDKRINEAIRQQRSGLGRSRR